MRWVALLTAGMFVISACTPRGSERAGPTTAAGKLPAVAPSRPSSAGTPAALAGEATPYPTLEAPRDDTASFLEKKVVIPAAATRLSSSPQLTSDEAPAEALPDILLGIQQPFSWDEYDGDGVLTAAFYPDEDKAGEAFAAWDEFRRGPLIVGGKMPLQGADEFISRLKPPLKGTEKNTLGYWALSYLQLRRCRLIVTVRFTDREAGSIPLAEGRGGLRQIDYLVARDRLNQALVRSVLGTTSTLQEFACAEDVRSALGEAQDSTIGSGAGTTAPIEILSQIVQGEGDNRVIYVEYINNGLRPVWSAEVTTNFLDGGGRISGSVAAYGDRYLVRPGELGSFTIRPPGSAAGWKSYELALTRYEEVVEWLSWTDQLVISGAELEQKEGVLGPEVYLRGMIMNTSDRTLDNIKVLALLYDADDKFVGVASGVLLLKPYPIGEMKVLAPGERFRFVATANGIDAVVHRYVAYAQGFDVSR
jgi:hypothetical protein